MIAPVPPARWLAALEECLARSLPGFLPSQRWFGGKARRIDSATLVDAVWLVGGGEPCALAIARVEYATGPPDRYALMVALRREPGASPRIGELEVDGEVRHAVEASGIAADVIELMRHLGRAHDLPGARGGRLRFGDTSPASAGGLDPAVLTEERVRPLGAEQSNTSLRAGDAHVFKLFRRMESGENPEVEVGRFLATHTSFRDVPALRGSATWLPPDGPPGTVGVLQDLVENEGDGWRWALDRLAAVFSLAAPPESVTDAIQSLGATTADLHAALASAARVPGFATEPATRADAESWEHDVRERASRTLRMLAAGLDGLAPEARATCEALLQLGPRVESAAAPPLPEGPAAFVKIRIHGDYHLGQTLKTGSGFVLIDFEGEPTRPLLERRRLHCALRDVAGMLRSFDYVVECARAGLPAAAWPGAVGDLREGFLRGYVTRAIATGAGFLPPEADARARWIAFFELEKVLYELEYEFQNRPEWLHIPARGLLRLFGEQPA